MSLQGRVHVARRFQRSIRIDTDLGDSRALEGFVCPRSSAEVLIGMARHVRDTGHAAFTWTGPYGTGKSSLVIALSALLNGSERLRREAATRIGLSTAKVIWEALPPKSRGWRVVPVVGRRASCASLIGEALVARDYVRARSVRRWTDERVLGTLLEMAAAHPRSEGGVVVVLDELGKLLEAAAQEGGDIYLLQQLAEAASRSDGRLLVVGVLHQAFDEYAQRLAREIRDEWAKVQGRFLDLVVNATGDEQLELLAQAIETEGKTPSVPSAAVVAKMVRDNRVTSRDLTKVLQRCWPLHPIVACLLGPLSRRRFGQNQRSLFGFLNSAEVYGFQDFLRSTSQDELFTPDRLWDYLRANLEPSILASPDGHRWSMAVEAVERCGSIGASEHHVALLKAIALIDLFRERSSLMATPDLLEIAFPGRKTLHVKQVLRDLVAWSFVLFRKHLGAYSVYAGSDFDLEAALSEALARQPEVSLRDLRALAGLRPILAKRHYHDTGALRWFDVDFVTLADVVSVAKEPMPEGGAVGRFLLAIPTCGEAAAKARQLCQAAADSAAGEAVIGLSGQAWHVVELARELLAITRIQDEAPALAGDAVARREVIARLASLRTTLESSLHKIFQTVEWFRRGQAPQRYGMAELNALVSSLADLRFPDSPRIHNELLNRAEPSSNAVAARTALLKRMALGEGVPRLGIEGFPAEGGLFEAILQKSGLYRQEEGQRWLFSAPYLANDTCRLTQAWRAAIQLVSGAGRPVSVSTIYELWEAPPFGVKAGLLPILGAAFVLAEKRRIALYRDGVFRARFTDLDADYLAIEPVSVQVRWMDLSGSASHLLSGLASVVQKFDSSDRCATLEPLEVAQGLVAIFDALSPWTKRTSRLSANATAVRDLFKRASDPNRFLFDDIPGLTGGPDSGPLAANTALANVSDGLEELVGAYEAMLRHLRDVMFAELQAPLDSPQALAELRARAANIHQLSGDFHMNAFISRLTQFTGVTADIEGLASLMVSKPARDWVDADLDQAALALAESAQKFIRLEAFARVKGRPDKRHAMAVVVGVDGRPTPVVAEFDIADSQRAAVDDVVERVELVLRAADPKQRNVILAALAEISARYLGGSATTDDTV